MSESPPGNEGAEERNRRGGELGVRSSVVVVLLSQIVGVIALVGVPMILVRTLEKSDYGLYVQFQLLLQTFLIFAIAGFPEALVYFVARERRAVADFLLGALIQLATALLVIAGVLLLLGPFVVHRIVDDRMVSYLWPVFLAVVFYALGDTLFNAQTAQRRFRTYSAVYIGFALIQSGVVAGIAITRKSLDAVIWAYVITGGVKALGALVYIGYELAASGWTARPRMLRAQWMYALPYTGTQSLKKINGLLHKFFISSSYSPGDYAAYDIGTKKVPAMGLVRTSFSQVMTPHFAEMESRKRHDSIRTLWHASVSRLCLVYFFITVTLIAFAPEAITVFFTANYADAIPIFRVFALMMMWESLSGIEGILKAFAQNRFILFATAFQFAITLLGSWIGLRWIGLLGPAIAVVASYSVGQWIRVVRTRSLLDVPYAQVLPWKQLRNSGALAIGSAAVGWTAGRWIDSAVGTLLVGIPLTAVLYGAGAVVLDLLPPSEKARLESFLRRFGLGRRG
jgi:O-antigen/teichoic acid export membrane protein